MAAMTYRQVFSDMRAKGASREKMQEVAGRLGFDPAVGLDAEVRPPAYPDASIGLAAPVSDPLATGGPTQLRSLAPGMPTVAGVGERGLIPVEQIAFTEEEAALGAPVSAPAERAPSVASETSQFADAARELDVSLARTPSFKGVAQEAQQRYEEERTPLARALGDIERAAKRSVSEMVEYAFRDEERSDTERRLGLRSRVELALDEARAREQEAEDREPDFATRALGRSMLSGGRPPELQDLAMAGVGEAVEAPIEYAADLAGTVFGTAVGAVEPIAAGLTGVAAALGIDSEAYDASVTRMERTMKELGDFYDSKLDDNLTSNIRSSASELQSGIFQVMAAIAGGAMTEDELKAANAIDRAVAGFSVGRTIGAQVTEGAVAAFALLVSEPTRAMHADPVGTWFTVVPILKSIKAAQVATGVNRLSKPAMKAVDRAISLYDQAADKLRETGAFGGESAKRLRRLTAATNVGAKRLHAAVTRGLAQEGFSIEPSQTRGYENIFRESEQQAALVKSAGEQFAREVKRATERGEIPIPQTVGKRQPLRASAEPDPAPDVVTSRPQEGVTDAPGDVFAPDDMESGLTGEREFEVYRAARDPLTEEIALKKSTTRRRSAMKKDLEKRYVAKGMEPEAAAKKASTKAKAAQGRGVYRFGRADLDKARKRLFKSLGGASKRIVDELGGTGLVKQKGGGAGLVDLGSDEFLEAMAEAIDLHAVNILSSAALRGKVSKALINAYSEASPRGITLKESAQIDKLVHDAASRIPAKEGQLGSAKVYDIELELPNGKRVSMLKLARGVVTDDKKLAALVFEQSIVSVAERLAQKVKQRRRQRGWLEELGGRDAIKRSKKFTEYDEATELARSWISDMEAGRPTSLPLALKNDPKRVYGALKKLPEDVKDKLPAEFWARFRKGKDFVPMSKEVAEFAGLVDMPKDVQKGLRAVQIDAPFKSYDDMRTIYIPKYLDSAIRLMKKTEEWRLDDGRLAQFERTFKGNMVARNIGSLMNALVGNLMYQMVRRGDPLVAKKMVDAVALYTKWRAGKLTNPDDIRMLEDIERTGALGSTYVKSELNKAYGEGAGGIGRQFLGKMPAGRTLSKILELQESGFSWTDAGAKLEDAIHNYRQLGRYKDMLNDGDWMQFRVGPSKSVRLYKSGDRWRLNTPDGRILSDAQVGSITGRASVYPGTKAFFDYNDPARMARMIRGGSKGGIFIGTVMNPYWTWQNKAMTIPGVQKGLAGEVLTNGVPVITNNKRVKLDQAMSQAAIGFRRAALVQGARNTLGDREYHEAMRNAYQYNDSRHQAAVSTFKALADPSYIGAKQWSSSTFLEPFDNMMGVIDALVSSPKDAHAADIRSESLKNKDLKAADNLYDDYNDMTMLFGSLDPNDKFELDAVFPPVGPADKQGPASRTIDQAFAQSDKLRLRSVPKEYRQEVKRIRTIIRDAWGGKKSAIASAADLAGMTGGILYRGITAAMPILSGKRTGEQAQDRLWNQVGPMVMGGTAYRVSKWAAGKGTVFRYLPPDADYSDTFDKLWTAITGLGNVHVRAIGKPKSSLGERKGILDKDITRLKTAMRTSIRDTLGKDIIDLNQKIEEWAPGHRPEELKELVDQRDNALIHWHKIMGTAKPGESKVSKGGLINTIAADHKRYVLEGWRRSPAPILTPGEERKGVPEHTLFDLF